MNLFELSAKISADTRDYEKAVKNATKVSKSLKDIMERSATQSETNKNKIKVLASEYSSAKAKVATLTTAFNKAAKEEGVTAERTKKLAKELQEAEKESSDLKGQLDELTQKSQKAGDGFSKLGSALGKGLKTAGKIGVAAVGAAAAGIAALTTASVNSFAEYEQLAGGAQKIFDQMDYSKIATDANNAYKELGLSANQYLAVINDVGATFAATMGDEAGYEAAKTGLKAISDYASGTGKNVDELSQKFTLITRSTSSYQSIADQFSGILPATSAGFLEQAQAAGILSDKYTQLTEVPIDEYQAAVSQMLQQGVADLGLANNTMNEAFSTLSGSLSMAKGAWSNLVTGLADDSADLDMLIGNFVESVGAVATNLIPKIGTALNGASKLVRDLIPVIVQEIPVLIEENLPILAEAAISIIQSLVDGISENQEMLMTTAFETITYLANSLITMLPQIVQFGLDLIVSLADGIAENTDELLPTIFDVVGEIIGMIIENAPRLAEAAFGIIDALGNSLAEEIPGLSWVFENLETAVIAVTAAMVAYKAATAISGVIDALRKATEGQTLAQALMNAVMNANPFVLIATLIAGLVAAIITLWNTNEGFRNAIISAWEAIKGAAETIFSAVADFFTETIPNAFNSVVDWFKNIGEKFADIGKNIVEGIKGGIQNAWNNLVEWFKGLFGDLIGIAKKILGIASPSKVFKKIGGFTAEGFGVGFEDEFDKVKSDMEKSLEFDNASIKINSSIQKTGMGRDAFGRNIGGVSVVQNIYSEAKTAADLMQEAIYQQEKAVMLGV